MFITESDEIFLVISFYDFGIVQRRQRSIFKYITIEVGDLFFRGPPLLLYRKKYQNYKDTMQQRISMRVTGPSPRGSSSNSNEV